MIITLNRNSILIYTGGPIINRNENFSEKVPKLNPSDIACGSPPVKATAMIITCYIYRVYKVILRTTTVRRFFLS